MAAPSHNVLISRKEFDKLRADVRVLQHAHVKYVAKVIAVEGKVSEVTKELYDSLRMIKSVLGSIGDIERILNEHRDSLDEHDLNMNSIRVITHSMIHQMIEVIKKVEAVEAVVHPKP